MSFKKSGWLGFATFRDSKKLSVSILISDFKGLAMSSLTLEAGIG